MSLPQSEVQARYDTARLLWIWHGSDVSQKLFAVVQVSQAVQHDITLTSCF